MKESEKLKVNAREATRRAIYSGRLARPQLCERCGKSGPQSRDGRCSIQAHHHLGYEKRLDVMWLCPKCHRIYDPVLKGEENGRAVLTADQVREIRSRYRPGQAGGHRALAKEFGISKSQIHRILKGEKWAECANQPEK